MYLLLLGNENWQPTSDLVASELTRVYNRHSSAFITEVVDSVTIFFNSTDCLRGHGFPSFS